ncbi:MAG TPA: tyrosine-type recombinase/integrase [Candidatus Acidoferrales bacterium]|nr:tyrosine-type recombinase/integrase [Candidatus Acidoferrales bacterium]
MVQGVTKQVLCVSDVAQFLGVPEADVLELIKKKLIPFVQIGETYRFYMPALHDWLMAKPYPINDSMIKTAISDMQFKNFADKYLEFVKENRAPKTLENAERVIRLATELFGEIILEKISLEHLRRYVEERRKNVSTATLSIDVRTLKAAMQLAVEWEYLQENPFKKFKNIRQERRAVKFLSRADMDKLLSAVREEYLKRLFIFAVLTCMRRGEIVFLRWDDVNFELRLINIHPADDHRTKFNKERSIPISPQIEELLKSIEHRGHYVFVNNKGERLLEDFVTKRFKAYCREIGLDESIHFHSLRKTGASWSAANGATPLAIRELLGHSSVKTTEIYLGVPSDSVRDAVERIKFNTPAE